MIIEARGFLPTREEMRDAASREEEERCGDAATASYGWSTFTQQTSRGERQGMLDELDGRRVARGDPGKVRVRVAQVLEVKMIDVCRIALWSCLSFNFATC